MAKKKDDGFQYLLGILGVALFSIFLINTIYVYKKYSKKYPLNDADIRVNDSGNFLRYIIQAACSGGIALLTFHMAYSSFFNVDYVKSIIFILICILFVIYMIILSARIATTQIGMLVYKSKGIFVIPADPHNNTLEDNILKLKALKDLCSMEEVLIKSVSKVTRQSGTKVFIHGSFGTRCVAWRDKQKRDECIAALEMACGKRLSSLDLGQ